MSKRLQVLIVEDEYLEIQAIARRRRMTVSEWMAVRRCAKQWTTSREPLKPSCEPSPTRHVTASRPRDIETMLSEMTPMPAPESSD